ncbi:MAG: AAA family ATPase [Deltaproteobacteria bacterium]|nr:AAA family ATPase [Deltaproteobacteria bacterium]
MIIGLTGKNGSGKGVVADYLKAGGFIYYSLSDIIREELTLAKKQITRENLIEMGRALRSEGGPSVLADKIMPKLDIDKNYIVDSIRNPAEVRSLRRRQDFYLLNVDADQKVRFERVKQRGRENDPTDFNTFVILEEKELKSIDPAAQQLIDTASLADVTLENNTTINDLECLVKQTVLDLVKKKPRPSWDEYFMKIAQVTSLRSNCLKRKVAAVIVKDKRIVSTGYNGTPRGVTNCCEGGCPRCSDFAPSGSALGECLCSHAEENAIVQAAYHGVSIKGSSIYTTFSPCLTCTKMILNSGIIEVIYNAAYPMGELPIQLLKGAGVRVRQITPPS